MALNILILILLTLNFIGIGQKILSRFKWSKKIDFEEKIFFSTALGIGFFEIIGLFLGFIGLFYRPIFQVLFFFILIFTFKEWNTTVKNIFFSFKQVKFEKNWLKVIFLAISLKLFVNFLIAQAPVTEGDALWYHLTLPKIFIRNHKIVDSYLLASYLSLNTEILYTWAMLLKDEILAQSLSFLIGGLFLTFALFAFCKKFFSKEKAYLASFIFIFTPLVSWEGVTPSVDLFWCFFILMAFWSVANWLRKEEDQWIYLAAIFLGLNLSTKYILGFLPILAISPILFWKLFSDKKKKTLIPFLAFATIPILFFLPYPLRNFFLTKNPFFPFLPKIFSGGGLDPNVLENLHQSLQEQSVTFIGFFKYLWDASMFPQKFGPDIGSIYISLIPLGIGIFLCRLYVKKTLSLSKIELFSLVFCSIFYLFFYIFLIHTTRYLLPLLPFFSIFLASTIFRLLKIDRLSKIIIILILALSIPINFLTYFWNYENYWPKLKVAFGFQDRKTYLLQTFPYLRDFFWINNNLPANSKILLFLDKTQRTFYLDLPFVVAGLLQREIDFSRPEKLENADIFLKTLTEHKITHIYGPEVPSSDEKDQLLGILSKIQNPTSGKPQVKKIHQGIYPMGNVYQIIPD